jgi:hypothetical protein
MAGLKKHQKLSARHSASASPIYQIDAIHTDFCQSAAFNAHDSK